MVENHIVIIDGGGVCVRLLPGDYHHIIARGGAS